MISSIEELRNPALSSGFHHVRFERVAGRPKPYVAEVSSRGQRRGATIQVGPHRATAEEAAQDYVDYINLQGPQRSQSGLKSAGHRYDIDRTERDPEVEAALGVLRDARAQREGVQGYVYCISDGEYIKVGYSVNPAKRVAELQTGNARPLRVLATMEGTLEDERRLHAQYAYNNVLQEWFEPDTDLLAEFDLADDDVSALNLKEVTTA